MFSKRICIIATILTVLIFSANIFAEAESKPKVGAREPLTYRNMGLYGWWQADFWEDNDFDFVIVQAFVLCRENAYDSEKMKEWNANLMKARAAGKRVIVVATAGQGRLFTEEYYQGIVKFLASVNRDELYAITFAEENIFWNGQHEKLTSFYYRLKKDYPDVPVFQWYIETIRGRQVPGFHYPWLPADGWIVDEYTAEPRDFEQQVRRYRMLGLPVIQLGWAAPEESIEFHASILLGQLRVAEKYNLPYAFYGWEGPEKRTHIWNECAEESSKRVFGLILDQVKKAKEVPEKNLLDWDDASKPLETVLEKVSDGVFQYREDFNLRMTEQDIANFDLSRLKNNQILVLDPKYGAFTNKDASLHDFMERSLVRGLRNMKWVPDPARIIIRSDGTGPVDASLTNHWSTPNGERCRFSASAKIKIEPKASVEVIFEVSPNGYDWVAKTTKIDDGLMNIELPKAQKDLYTRLRFAGKSAKAGLPLAAIDWIEVRGNIAK